MAEVPNLKNYIKRVTGEAGDTNDGEMPPTTVNPWLPVFAGTGGQTPTYTVGTPDYHSEDWRPTTDKEPFGVWTRRAGDMLWIKIRAMVAMVDEPSGAFVRDDSYIDEGTWPEDLSWESQIHSSVTMFKPNDGSLFVVPFIASEQNLAFGVNSGIEAGDRFGGNNRSTIIVLPLIQHYGGGL